jgi:hypothetical protein
LAIPIALDDKDFTATSLQLVGPRLSEADLLNAGRLIEASSRRRALPGLKPETAQGYGCRYFRGRLNNMRKAIPDTVADVLARYGLEKPSFDRIIDPVLSSHEPERS